MLGILVVGGFCEQNILGNIIKKRSFYGGSAFKVSQEDSLILSIAQEAVCL